MQQFFGTLPTAWDETRLLSGYPGRSVVLARRKGTDWYIAGINGLDEPQALALGDLAATGITGSRCLMFLDTDQPTTDPWCITTRRAESCKLLNAAINCRPRGGFVIHICQ